MIWASNGHSGAPCCSKGRVMMDMRMVLPAGREEGASGAWQDGLLEEMGSNARV